MNKNSFYALIAGALLLSISAASILASSYPFRGLIAAIAGLSALILMRYAARGSLRSGRDSRMKCTYATSSVIYELVLLLGALSTAVIKENPEIGFLALAGVAIAEVLDLEYTQKLKSTVSQDLGREVRILVLVASAAAFHFQQYYLFYGVALIFLIAAYDSLRLIHQIREEL